MSKKSIYLFVTLFILVIIGMFTFTALQKKNNEVPETVVATTTPETDNYGITRIDGKHYFINGLHTVVGEINMPTPCDLLTTKSEVISGTPELIKLYFDVINNSTDCAKITTTQRFQVTASSTGQATFEVYFKGRKVDLNLIEAKEGETPETFEVYNKG